MRDIDNHGAINFASGNKGDEISAMQHMKRRRAGAAERE
jgi:hypothetical protein